MGLDLNLTTTQALGVAISGVLSDIEMSDCQEMAIDIVKNLKSMGFNIHKFNALLSQAEPKDSDVKKVRNC